MACFVYHTKSCPHERLTLVLVHGKRSSSLTIVQLAIVARRFFCCNWPSQLFTTSQVFSWPSF
eukprot:14590475-Ditylum_brightwellii.AAC.1